LLAAGKSVLLLFVGPDCWGCKVLLPVVRTWQQEYADQLTVAVLSRSTFAESQAKMAKYELDNLLLDENSSVADDYQTKWTPGIVLIDRQGKIASQIIYGDNAIREFVRNTIASGQLPLELHHRNGQANHIPQVAIRYSVRKIGEPAPSFMLLDLSGSIVKLEDLLGDSVLLLFWHPRCQFCRAMFEDLREWEEQSPVTAPKLVFIASGSEEEIKAMNWGLKSLTLLDSSLDVGSLFGTKQTPAAILIDGEGRIASSLAIGDPNVRALVGLPKAQPVLIS
jgi:peroxiredoxin